jgi:chromosome segregation ATPase
VRIQAGLLESWELLPEAYRPLLDEDIFTIVDEIEGAARLASQREALRRHLESVDRREISYRIENLEQDLAELEESALSGRRGELASYEDILGGISMINAQLEDAECLLSNLRGQLLALATSHSPCPLEPGLAQLQSRVGYFRQSMDEVTRRVKTLPAATTEGLPAR